MRKYNHKVGHLSIILAATLLQSLILLAPLTVVHASTVTVAVASNYARPLQQIAERFTQHTGHNVRLSSGSSGQLATQIQNGAPFDIFLSADQALPEKLEALGLTVKGSRFTYAHGRLVLWSLSIEDPLMALKNGQFTRLALANPELAPYGKAAAEVLEALGLSASDSWVFGENISQTYQFVATANASLGFIAHSQWKSTALAKKGYRWEIPENLHTPILQDAVLLKRGANSLAARQLMEFLNSQEAQQLNASLGY